MLTSMYAQVREEEQVISLQFTVLVVSKMYPSAGERSGSKSMMVLQKRNGLHCIGP